MSSPSGRSETCGRSGGPSWVDGSSASDAGKAPTLTVVGLNNGIVGAVRGNKVGRYCLISISRAIE